MSPISVKIVNQFIKDINRFGIDTMYDRGAYGNT